MRIGTEEFKNQKNKAVTLLGMSGVGKTTISDILKQAGWFHYSVDYRIGTAYLNEAILENITNKAKEVPYVGNLLKSGTIEIENHLTIDNLAPLSAYVGQVGNPEKWDNY